MKKNKRNFEVLWQDYLAERTFETQHS